MKTLARASAVAGLIALLAFVAAATPAGARVTPEPAVDVQSVTGLAPDGRTIGVRVLASCPERWTVVQALVTVSQPGASGQASFPLTCIRDLRMFHVDVPSSGANFQLGEANVTASVVVKRGKTARAEDSETVTVQPTVLVELAESAQLESGGGAVVMDVTVACPSGTTGLESGLGVSQGETRGSGPYTPVCDGSRHTFTVRVEAIRGLYQAGIAQALTFADVEHAGEIFSGVDDDGSLEILS